MVKIPTFIPESTAKSIGQFFRGPVLDILWRLFLVLLLILILYAIGSAGGSILAAFIVFTLGAITFKENVRDGLEDIYYRDFWVWKS